MANLPFHNDKLLLSFKKNSAIISKTRCWTCDGIPRMNKMSFKTWVVHPVYSNCSFWFVTHLAIIHVKVFVITRADFQKHHHPPLSIGYYPKNLGEKSQITVSF